MERNFSIKRKSTNIIEQMFLTDKTESGNIYIKPPDNKIEGDKMKPENESTYNELLKLLESKKEDKTLILLTKNFISGYINNKKNKSV